MVEILQGLLDELKGVSLAASHLISNTLFFKINFNFYQNFLRSFWFFLVADKITS